MSLKIIGINICETRGGIKLYDGGCALIEGGIPKIAIAEERLSRKKYDGNFIRSLKYCLENTKNKIKDIDKFVFSNCCDEPLDKSFLQKLLNKYDINIPKGKIIICPSHHLSHACSVFFSSPFQRALILVVDNEGNILEKKYNEFWINRLERTSFYIGNKNNIRLIGRLHDGFEEFGIGVAYHYFTRWLGFPSYQDASKVMSLAAYGRGEFKKVNIFNRDFKCLFNKNFHNRNKKIESVVREFIFKVTGKDIGKRSYSTENYSKLQKEIAWLVQRETEKVMIKLVGYLIKKYGITNLCISGGVGLNCVANYKILRESGIKNLFILPATGDTGQCLGNAYYGYYCYLSEKRRRYIMESNFLGKDYTEEEIKKALKKYCKKIIYRKTNKYIKEASALISRGKIIGWFQGKSEFGPRALGDRSILADPRHLKSKDALDKRIKFREKYRPYAPSVLEEKVANFFGIDKKSPFMLLAIPVKKEKRNIIPAVIHVDGTSRIQTVSTKQNKIFYNLIKEFQRLTGVPLLLNTSFNRKGEPIIETPEDAIKCFLETGLDFLVIKNYIIQKI